MNKRICLPVKNPGANMHTICICTTVLLSEKEKRGGVSLLLEPAIVKGTALIKKIMLYIKKI